MKIISIWLMARFALWLMVLALCHTPYAIGHPGKTDKDGCHKVTQDYKYIGSKKVLKAGTTHCHGGLGKMRLGKEILEDPYDAAEEVKPAKSNRPSLKASGDPPKPPAKGEGKSK